MDGNSLIKNDPNDLSLMELFKKYTDSTEQRDAVDKDTLQIVRPQQEPIISNEQIDESKAVVNKSQSKASSIFDSNLQQTDEDQTNVNYKTKWEESEAKYRQLEKKYRQLENVTVKQLQEKIDQLQRDYNQIKLVKDRMNEICSCRQLTSLQYEQLKLLVNTNNPNNIKIETIANKNDFHQQTIKLRSIILKHNEELLNKIDELVKKKRKRNQYEDELSDDDDANE